MKEIKVLLVEDSAHQVEWAKKELLETGTALNIEFDVRVVETHLGAREAIFELATKRKKPWMLITDLFIPSEESQKPEMLGFDVFMDGLEVSSYYGEDATPPEWIVLVSNAEHHQKLLENDIFEEIWEKSMEYFGKRGISCIDPRYQVWVDVTLKSLWYTHVFEGGRFVAKTKDNMRSNELMKPYGKLIRATLRK
ncbi:hypothetical protein ACFL08_04050 [Patescibacteria group bacterium]